MVVRVSVVASSTNLLEFMLVVLCCMCEMRLQGNHKIGSESSFLKLLTKN